MNSPENEFSTLQSHPVFALSSSQKNIWNLERLYSGTPMNIITTALSINGTFKISFLIEAIQLVLKSDSALRIQIHEKNGTPIQRVSPYTKPSIPVFDFSQTGKEGLLSWEKAVAHEAFPINDHPLFYFSVFKTGETSGGVLFKIHHLISDGWSQTLIANRIASIYQTLLNGEALPKTSFPDYSEHLKREQMYLDSEIQKSDENFWKKQASLFKGSNFLKKQTLSAKSTVGERKSFVLPDELDKTLKVFCQQNHIAPFLLFYAALAIYQQKISDSPNICIGVPILNRPTFLEKQMTGMFVSTLPFVFEIDESETFEELIQNLAVAWYDLLRHQQYPFQKITELFKKSIPETDRIFQVALSYQDTHLIAAESSSLNFSGHWFYSGCQAEALVIHLGNLEIGSTLSIDYDYRVQLFSEKEITNLHESLIEILKAAVESPQKMLAQLPILPKSEQEKILFQFNKNQAPIKAGSLYENLLKAAKGTPQKTALVCENTQLSFGQLFSTAENFASAIHSFCPNGHELIAVTLPKGPLLIAAMIGIAQSGNAWVLLPQEFPSERLKVLLKESGAALWICDKTNLEKAPLLTKIPCLSAEAVSLKEASFKALPVSQDSLAYVVYTSGSTSIPKGVEIEQKSLLNFASGMAAIYEGKTVLSICNIGFDAFLLESICALLNGCTVVLATQKEQENPDELARLILSQNVSFLSTTPSRLAAYLQSETFADSISGLEGILCGGESIPWELIETLKSKTHAKIYNQYGPSEATIGVSLQLLNSENILTAGTPMQNCSLYILNSHLQPLPIGVSGELFIGGVCLSRGYHGRKDLTESSFCKNPFVPGERLYKTGDLAHFTADGKIILDGRKDQQIKLRGYRMEPQEIISCLTSHPQIKEAALRLFHQGEASYLAAYYTSDSDLSETQLITYMASYLPAPMIPTVLIKMTALPLTANGKVDEKQLPKPQEQTGDALAETTVQKALLQIFRRVLKQESLNIDSDYFLSGGDSLNAMGTLCQIHDQLGVSLKISDLYAFRTVRRLEKKVQEERSQCGISVSQRIQPAPLHESYPLSPAQKSLYFQSQLDPQKISYNMPGAFVFSEKPDEARLESAFCELISDEEIFRTAFYMNESEPRQKILENVPFRLQHLDAETFAQAADRFVHPFKLEEPPLLRAALWHSPKDKWILLIDSHHIIGDGLSTPLLLQRLNARYCGDPREPQRIFYKDYAYLLENQKSSSSAHFSYWEKALSGAPDFLDIPLDFARPKQFDYCGDSIEFSLSHDLSEKCQKYCQKNDLSFFTFFIGVYGILLSKWSGTEDFLIGTPVSNRPDPALQNVLGVFIHSLPLRITPQRKETCAQYFSNLKGSVIGLLDHPSISMEELISITGAQRDLSRNALFNILFSYRPISEKAFQFDGKPLKYLPIPTKTAKLDLNMEARDENGQFIFYLEYAKTLFLPETIQLLSRSYCTLVERILQNDQQKLYDLDPTSEKDRLELLVLPNRMSMPYLNECMDQIFDETAAIIPNSPAIRCHGHTTTFAQLKARSDSLAGQLQRAGVKHGDYVALAASRDSNLVAGMLGILKAGAAYMPILSNFPQERICYMLDISGAKLLFCDSKTQKELPDDLPCKVLAMTDEAVPLLPVSGRSPEDAIHILFTSGSTGKPKGAVLPHRALANLLGTMRQVFKNVRGASLCIAGVIFDTFITETLLTFAMGRCCVMADENEMLLPWEIARLVREEHVEFLQFTPTRLQMCLNNEEFLSVLPQIKLLFSCGELLTPQLLESLRKTGVEQIYNLYGPTEVTVYMTCIDMTHRKKISVGKAIPNCHTYVLDENLRPVMPTARGELYIGGDCLSIGYVNRPDLTESSYLPDPFCPGSRMYKSGDIVRMLPDRSFDFVERRDLQVKLNGQRVELDEIAGQILASKLVAEAAVIAVRSKIAMELRAFVVPKKGQSSPDLSALKTFLSEKLPKYMIPSTFVVLKFLPRTASGKTDRQALKAYRVDSAASISPQKDSCPPILPQKEIRPSSDGSHDSPTEEILLEIWTSVLNRENLDPDESFFDQGGTSLTALTILSRYFRKGWTMTLAQFYEAPTLHHQLKLLSKGSDSLPKTGLYKKPAEPKIFSSAISQIDSEFSVSPAKKSAVFLTGSTGFLGSHLLKELLDNGCQKLYCLVRGGEPERLFQILSDYFGEQWVSKNKQKLTILDGNLCRPLMGLSESTLNELTDSVGTILHAAADVRHYAEENLSLRTNVDGTVQAIRLAQRIGAELLHISTASVCGDYLLEQPSKEVRFTENDLDIGQNWEENLYIKGKFLAEQKIFSAASHGLRAKIFRIGRLVGRSQDGKFQRNPKSNAFYGLLRGLLLLNCVPDSLKNTPIELCPVDECAKAIVLLSLHSSAKSPAVYHLLNPHTLPLWELVHALSPSAQIVEDSIFEKRMLQKMEQLPELLIAPLVEIWNHSRSKPVHIIPSCEQTVMRLQRLGFEWKNPEPTVLLKQFLQFDS